LPSGVCVRRRAEALEVLGPPEAVQPLVAMLDDERNDPFGHESAAATRALGTLDAWDVVESLLAMRGEPAWRLCAAIEVLAMCGAEAPIVRILAALKDSSAMVRASAAAVLEILGDDTLLAPLVAALDDRWRRYVRRRCARCASRGRMRR